MIVTITIHRLRGILEGELSDLAPLSVLVGPNGSGKSTILDALLIGGRPRPAEAIFRVIARREEAPASSRWLLWKAGVEGEARVTVESERSLSRVCVLRPGIGFHVRLSTGETGGGTVNVSESGGLQHSSSVDLPIEGIAEVGLVESRNTHQQRSLHELYTQTVEQGRRREAIEILKELVPDFQNLEILTEGNTPIVHIVFTDHSVPIAFAGDGVRFLLRQSLELAARSGGVVLIEEPEAHLHPSAIRQSARVLLAAVRRGIQVVISTHSLELIDHLLVEAQDDAELSHLSVFRVRLENGRLISHRIPGPEVARVRGTIEDDLR